MMKVVDIAVGIVRDADRVLHTRRPPGSHLEGFQEFPGGKVEPGETPEECVHREVLEETGLVVRCETLLETVTHEYPDRAVRISFFECKVVGGALDPSLQEAGWIPLADLPAVKMPAANQSIIAKLTGEWESTDDADAHR